MNTIAKKWVEALRSGKYGQATGVLCRNDSYCCLGVLCVVCIEEGIKIERVGDLFDGHSAVTPGKAVRAAGLCTPLGAYESNCLSSLNDSGKEIADVIESEPKGLFT